MIIKSTKITKPTKSSKPKLGIFSLTSCDGCQTTFSKARANNSELKLTSKVKK